MITIKNSIIIFIASAIIIALSVWKRICDDIFSNRIIYTIIIIREIREVIIENATAVNASFDIFFFIVSLEFKVDVNKDNTPNNKVNRIEKIASNELDTSNEKK